MYQFSFEKLELWQLSRSFSSRVYQMTMNFPSEEKFGLTSQIRRAVISVASNLAEGSGRARGKEQARFSEISYAFLMEVLCQLTIAVDLGFLTINQLDEARPLINAIANKINSLRRAQLNR